MQQPFIREARGPGRMALGWRNRGGVRFARGEVVRADLDVAVLAVATAPGGGRRAGRVAGFGKGRRLGGVRGAVE
ncbi:hypothetical protein GCM10023205_08140 [Yinghuangia aomiensis]|uniref:Uncharacterized protein n=1 Tax=Yinghuangia aomiensis TaxID=676205 RepID=A0ABP9GY13_9ACTN